MIYIVIQDDILRGIIETDPTKTTRQIAQDMVVSHETIVEHLVLIGKVWILYDNRKRSGQGLDKTIPKTLSKGQNSTKKDYDDSMVVDSWSHSL